MNAPDAAARIAAAALLAAGLVYAGCRRQPAVESAERTESAIPVVAQPAATGRIRTTVQATGVVTPMPGAEFLVIAPAPARVVDVTKAEGAPVASGETLVRFELPSATQEVARLSADLSAAQAQVENARITQTRARDFASRGLIPRVELEAADRALADAQATLERTRVAHTAAEAAAAQAVVKAPFDGVVAQRLHNPGDLVQSAATDPVLRVVDPKRLEVTASVPAADAARVVPGASARLTSPLDARVIRLAVAIRASAAPRQADGTVPVTLEFVDPADIPVNARVDVEIDAEERENVVFVPAEAVIMENGRPLVMIATGDRAERRVVTTGLADVERVEITSGLTAGELVITQGQIGLPPGALISVAIAR